MTGNVPSPREMLDQLPSHFVPEAAGDAQATVHLELTGPQGGQWTLRVANRQCEVLDGLQGTPNLTISADGQDYVEIMEGRLAPMQAFMQGRVRFKGDLGVAMRMQSWFRISPPNGR